MARDHNQRWYLGAVMAAVFFCLATVTPSFSWNGVGHEVIARIAWDELEPAAREEAVRLLLATHQEVELLKMRPRGGGRQDQILFERAATWPDYIRSEVPSENRPSWHYTNYFWMQNGKGQPQDLPDMQPAEVNLLTELPRLVSLLGDRGQSDHDRGIALAWVLHLAGDLHQPLHCSARVTAADPSGDRGGNSFKLEPAVKSEPDRRLDNLHSLWDSALTRSLPKSFWESDWRYRERLSKVIRETPIVSDFSVGFEPDEAARTLDVWVLEGFALAKRACYPPALVRDRPAPDSVVDSAATESMNRMRLAGLRLARVLEAVL